jgi:hypothetical protein
MALVLVKPCFCGPAATLDPRYDWGLRCVMISRELAIVLLACTGACGGTTAGPADSGADSQVSSQDAGADSQEAAAEASLDSGEFVCGDAACDDTQICFYPACGCPMGGGPCGPPSCVTPTPGMGTYDCSAGDAGAKCSMVHPPIPMTCSRECHGICA